MRHSEIMKNWETTGWHSNSKWVRSLRVTSEKQILHRDTSMSSFDSYIFLHSYHLLEVYLYPIHSYHRSLCCFIHTSLLFTSLYFNRPMAILYSPVYENHINRFFGPLEPSREFTHHPHPHSPDSGQEQNRLSLEKLPKMNGKDE